MRKIFLVTSVILGTFIFTILLLIYIFIHPDYFKPLIISQIEKYTGCQIIIDDHLFLSFFPYFGVRANHIQMMMPSESQTPSIKIDIKNSVMQLKLLPLLHGKYETGLFQADQLTLSQQDPLLTVQFKNIRIKTSTINKLNNSFMVNLSFDFVENSFPLVGNAFITGHIIVDWKNNYVDKNKIPFFS